MFHIVLIVLESTILGDPRLADVGLVVDQGKCVEHVVVVADGPHDEDGGRQFSVLVAGLFLGQWWLVLGDAFLLALRRHLFPARGPCGKVPGKVVGRQTPPPGCRKAAWHASRSRDGMGRRADPWARSLAVARNQ